MGVGVSVGVHSPNATGLVASGLVASGLVASWLAAAGRVGVACGVAGPWLGFGDGAPIALCASCWAGAGRAPV